MKGLLATLLVLVLAQLLLLGPCQGARAGTGTGYGPDVFECSRVESMIQKCFPYLRGTTSHPPPSCCNDVKWLTEMAIGKEDRRLGCKCYQEASSYFNNIRNTAFLDLSKECQMPLPVDCI